jgi:hypothetical protein
MGKHPKVDAPQAIPVNQQAQGGQPPTPKVEAGATQTTPAAQQNTLPPRRPESVTLSERGTQSEILTTVVPPNDLKE